MKANLLSSVSKCCVTHPWRPPLPPGIHVNASGFNSRTITCYIKGDKRPRTVHLDEFGRGFIPDPDYDAGQTQSVT